jgi:hypothetical protein
MPGENLKLDIDWSKPAQQLARSLRKAHGKKRLKSINKALLKIREKHPSLPVNDLLFFLNKPLISYGVKKYSGILGREDAESIAVVALLESIQQAESTGPSLSGIASYKIRAALYSEAAAESGFSEHDWRYRNQIMEKIDQSSSAEVADELEVPKSLVDRVQTRRVPLEPEWMLDRPSTDVDREEEIHQLQDRLESMIDDGLISTNDARSLADFALGKTSASEVRRTMMKLRRIMKRRAE